MNLIALAVLLLVMPTLQAAIPKQAEIRGAIEGTVLREDNGAPVAGAQVLWTSSLDPPNLLNGPNPNPPTTTDSDGKFAFKDLKPATYRLVVNANGYVRQEYGQRVLYGAGKPVNVAAGETVKDLSISLKSSATVSGRILTDSGKPATDILVQLVRAMYGPQGRSFQGVGMTSADDRGEYRIYDVTPGRYYLVVGNVLVLQMPAPGAGDVISMRMSQTSYGVSFYPGASELDGASLLELKPGLELRADMTVKSQLQSFRVTGRVLDRENGQAASAATTLVIPQFSPQAAIQPLVTARNSNSTGGAFEFLVPPGDWTVQAEVPVQTQRIPGPLNPATAAALSAAQAVRPYGQTTFKVTNGDIEGLVVTLRTGATIAGRISLDDGQPLSALSMDRIFVRFEVLNAAGPSVSRTLPDGTFQIAGIRDGEYLPRVSGIPPGFYVKSVQYGSEDGLSGPLRFSGSRSDVLEIVLRSGAAQVSGSVTDANSQPVAGIQVILIPDPSRRNRTELYKTVVTDQNGRFTIPSIPPGDYKVFSWEALEQNGYYDPELMKGYESQGQEIRVEESRNATANVRIIPALQNK